MNAQKTKKSNANIRKQKLKLRTNDTIVAFITLIILFMYSYEFGLYLDDTNKNANDSTVLNAVLRVSMIILSLVVSMC